MTGYVKEFTITGDLPKLDLTVELIVDYDYEPSDDGIDDFTCITINDFRPNNIDPEDYELALARKFYTCLRENLLDFDHLQDEILTSMDDTNE